MEDKNSTISLTPVPAAFLTNVKIGVYRELHKKGLLTKNQLDALIRLQKNEAAFNIQKNVIAEI